MRQRATRQRQRSILTALLTAAATGLISAPASAGVLYTWNTSAGGNWSTGANWTVTGNTFAYPKNKDSYAQFTGTLTGSIGVSIDVADALGYFALFNNAGNY